MVLSVWLLLSSAGPVVSKVKAVKMAVSIKWITKCKTARLFPIQNLDFMYHYCWSFCWFSNFWEELRILMQPHYLWNYLEREFSRAERGRLRSDLFSFSLRFHDLKRIQKPPKVPFWLKAKCESFKMNLMMSLSLSLKRVKIFLLRILEVVGTCSTRNIENEKENVSVMKYIAVFRCAFWGLFLTFHSS